MMNDTPTDSGFAAPPVLTVSALNQAVARLLERSFPLTWIAGEISNFTRAASGHWYFTLKDDGAQVRAVMFRGRAQFAGFTPREGDKVEVRALVTLYGARGDYQINVEAIRRAGVGALYEAFQRLKEKLAAQGLFDKERKRAIPMFARSIGIVTSPQAAALRDVLIALKRRAPHVNIILYPTPVQGQQAPEKIAHAIRTASTRAECDVLLVCRGGGSIEDLWSFNDEAVAYAIADCSMPVISGVGHETDFTIADFAADLRADAADLRRAMRRRLDDAAQTLDRHSRRLLNPKAQLQQQRLQLLALSTAMTHAARAPVNQSQYALERLRNRLAALRPDVTAPRARLLEAQRRGGAAIAQLVTQRRHRLDGLAAQLELLNPQRTLERGYAILRDEKGAIVRSPAQLQARQNVNVRLAEGSAQIGIASVQATLE